MKEFSSQERWRLAGTVLSETKALVFMKALPPGRLPGRRRSQQEKSTRPRLGFPFFLTTCRDANFFCAQVPALKGRPKLRPPLRGKVYKLYGPSESQFPVGCCGGFAVLVAS